MARKPIPRDLPPPAHLVSGFPGFDEALSKQASLTDHLRKIALRLQSASPRAFYSMREVVNQFDLPLRTVALAYEALEHEGLLNRRRSSHTLLVGKKISPRKHVRAVVGIPVWLHAMVVAPYSRLFHVELEDRLRQHGFVADLIFFRGEEVTSPDFAQRLIEHNLDYVLWHTPHPQGMDVLRSLRDHGVRQLLVQPIDCRLSIALPTYLQDWQTAYATLAAAWHEAGIRHVIVPDPVYLPSRRAKSAFAQTLSRTGLEVHFVESTAENLRTHVKAHRKGACAVAFIDQEGADTICNEEPVIIEDLIRLCRVAFCRGPIRMPYFHHRDARIDIVRFSATEIATRIASDLSETLGASQKVLHTFQASFMPQVSFRASTELL
ncbi:MAG: hypothetical protein K0R17_2689 [Rariglobus sp.]|jgi:hypothetical protein|nr:hypothetical protein [Rariglobus sp.]